MSVTATPPAVKAQPAEGAAGRAVPTGGAHLVIRGRLAEDSITARLRRASHDRFLLLTRGFNSVQEQPYNR